MCLFVFVAREWGLLIGMFPSSSQPMEFTVQNKLKLLAALSLISLLAVSRTAFSVRFRSHFEQPAPI